ncbi:MAG: extracellular solute-binding protein [Treponema sp.]|nr:extracellular solute-binding protein [Treponema sp.]
MATIKDVAREAGLSTATVSCVLSGKKNVSHAARIRIMAAIEKLGYIPNENARKLKLRTSRDIGILLTSIDDIYHSEILKGISSVIQANNYSVNISFSNNQPKAETEALNDFISRNYAGIILASCITDNQYFQKLLSRKIPVVFVGHRPRNPDVNFAGITNGKTIEYLAESLIDAGYVKNIALFCGSPGISSENACADAFKKAFRDRVGICIYYTNMSKEDSFRVALSTLASAYPDAIIATSENIAHGILESAKVLNLPVPLIISFAEETWIDTKYLSPVVHTSRPAFKLGVSAASLLLENIKEQKHETVLLDDNIIKMGISLPRFAPAGFRAEPVLREEMPELNLLMLDCNLAHAISVLADKFEKDHKIRVNVETGIQSELHNVILEDSLSSVPKYDIFMFDIPWLNFLAQNECLEDLTGLITEDRDFYNSIIKENLINSMYRSRYYSIPIFGGAQLLFYRTDVFENPVISKDYFSQTERKLRPPKTWKEFNSVARFFTREFNSASPVEFGTSCPGIMAEELCPEIYIRIWGHNGALFSENNIPQLDSKQNIRAFENLIEAQRYVSRPLFETSIIDTVEDFYRGKTAMLITYTEYATKIMDAINRNVSGKLGFTFIPQRTPISTGWNLGLNPYSSKKEHAFAFFKWLFRKDVNYYLTILDGQSTSIYPYENNELLKLYPWMGITIDNFKFSRKRLTSDKKNSIIIPWNRIENIIYSSAKKMFENNSVSGCLSEANSQISHLLSMYGHV